MDDDDVGDGLRGARTRRICDEGSGLHEGGGGCGPTRGVLSGRDATSNGSQLLKFHSGLLAQMIGVGSPITAAYLQYSLVEDNGLRVTVADDVCYWGDRNMLAHIFKFLGLRGVRAEVRFAPQPIEFSDDGRHRKMAALEARSAIAMLAAPGKVT